MKNDEFYDHVDDLIQIFIDKYRIKPEYQKDFINYYHEHLEELKNEI